MTVLQPHSLKRRENQHKSCHANISTFCSLLYGYLLKSVDRSGFEEIEEGSLQTAAQNNFQRANSGVARG